MKANDFWQENVASSVSTACTASKWHEWKFTGVKSIVYHRSFRAALTQNEERKNDNDNI